jgi:hypothetical protein
MATTQSNFNQFQTSSSATRFGSRNPVTAVTPLPPVPRRQSVLPATLISRKEPEDALLTGGTRSLDRRLLALNLAGSLVVTRFVRPKAVSGRIIPRPQSAVA